MAPLVEAVTEKQITAAVNKAVAEARRIYGPVLTALLGAQEGVTDFYGSLREITGDRLGEGSKNYNGQQAMMGVWGIDFHGQQTPAVSFSAVPVVSKEPGRPPYWAIGNKGEAYLIKEGSIYLVSIDFKHLLTGGVIDNAGVMAQIRTFSGKETLPVEMIGAEVLSAPGEARKLRALADILRKPNFSTLPASTETIVSLPGANINCRFSLIDLIGIKEAVEEELAGLGAKINMGRLPSAEDESGLALILESGEVIADLFRDLLPPILAKTFPGKTAAS